jgi:hypothetical protein
MMKKILAVFLVLVMVGSVPGNLHAQDSLTSSAASLLIPGLGQYLNGQHHTREGKIKIGVMAAAEFAAILTTAIVGGTAGHPAVWSGLSIFIVNHIWSAADAYIFAERSAAVDLRGPRAR